MLLSCPLCPRLVSYEMPSLTHSAAATTECAQQSCGPYDKAMRQCEAHCNIAQCLVIVSGSLHGISWLQHDVTISLQTDVVLNTRVD